MCEPSARREAAEISFSSGALYTVLYDGRCAVCGRLAAIWIRWDRAGRLEILPSQAVGQDVRFPQILAEDFDRSLQVVGRDGRVWQGAESFARVFEVLPGARWIPAVLRLPLLCRLAERAYRAFARNRFRFGCSAHCAARPHPGPRKAGPRPT